jgi:hypothetical protein
MSTKAGAAQASQAGEADDAAVVAGLRRRPLLRPFTPTHQSHLVAQLRDASPRVHQSAFRSSDMPSRRDLLARRYQDGCGIPACPIGQHTVTLAPRSRDVHRPSRRNEHIMSIDIRKPLKKFVPHLAVAREQNLKEADTMHRIMKAFEDVLGYDPLAELTREMNLN